MNKEYPMKNQHSFNLQERIINFSLLIMKIVEELPKSYTGQHFAKQLVRSGTSPAFQYGEAQAAESRKDFIHKLKIGQKELRETFVCLTIIKKHPLSKSEKIDVALIECDELIAIFHTSVNTAKKNLSKNEY